MNREILFRAKRIDNDKHVYGHYYEYNMKSYICYQDFSDCAETQFNYEVHSDSLSQSTGLFDIDGQLIYENDELEMELKRDDTRKCIVIFKYGMFKLKWTDKKMKGLETPLHSINSNLRIIK